LMARDAVAVETLARLAISRRSILCLSERDGEPTEALLISTSLSMIFAQSKRVAHGVLQ
jgi:hypothetical protein